MKMSQKDLAAELGCARSTLSEATKEGHLIDGQWDVQEWVVRSPSGRVEYYDVPEDKAFLDGRDSRSNPASESNLTNSAPNSGDSAPAEPELDLLSIFEDQQETTRKVAEEAGDRTQLVPEGTDVAGTTQNAGLAYAAGKAIEHDTPGARAFWVVGSGLAGGLGGYAATEDAVGALIGAILFGGVGYLSYEQQPRSQDPGSRTQQMRSGHQLGQNGTQPRRRSRAVDLSGSRKKI